LLQSTLGPDVGLELGQQLLEFFAVFSGDDELGGGESVFAGVLRRAGLAIGGARAGAEAGIGEVGGLPGFCCPEVRLRDMAMGPGACSNARKPFSLT